MGEEPSVLRRAWSFAMEGRGRRDVKDLALARRLKSKIKNRTIMVVSLVNRIVQTENIVLEQMDTFCSSSVWLAYNTQ